MKAVNHGERQMDLRHLGYTAKEARPIELHHNTNGSVTNEPTFCMVMAMPSGLNIIGQFSLATLRACLNELGYEIRFTINFIDDGSHRDSPDIQKPTI